MQLQRVERFPTEAQSTVFVLRVELSQIMNCLYRLLDRWCAALYAILLFSKTILNIELHSSIKDSGIILRMSLII